MEGKDDENAQCAPWVKQSIYLYFCLLRDFKVNNLEWLILEPHCILKETHASHW